MTDQPPLYARIRASIVQKLVSGEWGPGATLPSETALARQMGVSQGTLRKAIDALCDDGALVRIHGRGTFVAEQTPELANFRFFPVTGEDGARIVPELLRQILSEEEAGPRIAAALGIEEGTPVYLLDRLRAIHGRPAIVERISVPTAFMPGLAAEGAMPNALYPHYQARHGIHIVRTEEQLGATGADARTAQMMRVTPGTPLLVSERTAIDVGGRAVEHRISYFLTEGCTFRVTLG